MSNPWAALKARIAYALEPNRTIPRILVHLGHFATGALICTLGLKLSDGLWFWGVALVAAWTVAIETHDMLKYRNPRDSAEDALQLMGGAIFMLMPGLWGLWWLLILAVPYVIRRVP